MEPHRLLVVVRGAVVALAGVTNLSAVITARSVIRSPPWGMPVRIPAEEILGWTADGSGRWIGVAFLVRTKLGETRPVATAPTFIAGRRKIETIEAEGLE